MRQLSTKASPPAAAVFRHSQGCANSRPSFSMMRKPVPPHSPHALMRRLRSIERPAKAVRALVATQLLLGLALDLADPLAGQPQGLPDLLQGLRLLSVEPEAQVDHLA